MLKVINKADSAEIYITGDIIDDADGAFMQSWGEADGYQWPAEIKAQLDSVKGKPLTIYINSNGGSVPAGVAMANMIARHDAPTKAVIDGWCCSIATQVFFACDSRAMPSNAYLMIHKPATVAAGNSDDLLQAAEFLDVIQQGLETTYQKAARPELDAKKIHAMVEHETWLTGTEAAALFDIELLDAVPVLNCVSAKQAANMKPPEELNIKPEEEQRPVFDCAEDNANGISEASKKFAAALVDEIAADNDNEAARIKAALAIAKGVITQ